MKYAKIISEYSVDVNPPRSAYIDGRLVTGELPASYLATIGFYPLIEAEEPSEQPSEGNHWAKRYAFDETESVVRQTWTLRPNPPPVPRVFSRLYIELAVAKLGLIDEFDTILKGIEIEPGYTAYRAFERSNEISEDFPNFSTYVSSIKTALNLTDEQVEEVLSESVKDKD